MIGLPLLPLTNSASVSISVLLRPVTRPVRLVMRPLPWLLPSTVTFSRSFGDSPAGRKAGGVSSIKIRARSRSLAASMSKGVKVSPSMFSIFGRALAKATCWLVTM